MKLVFLTLNLYNQLFSDNVKRLIELFLQELGTRTEEKLIVKTFIAPINAQKITIIEVKDEEKKEEKDEEDGDWLVRLTPHVEIAKLDEASIPVTITFEILSRPSQRTAHFFTHVFWIETSVIDKVTWYSTSKLLSIILTIIVNQWQYLFFKNAEEMEALALEVLSEYGIKV